MHTAVAKQTHLTPNLVEQLPKSDPQRAGLSVARFLEALPTDPSVSKPIEAWLVGACARDPSSRKEPLEFIVTGVSASHLVTAAKSWVSIDNCSIVEPAAREVLNAAATRSAIVLQFLGADGENRRVYIGTPRVKVDESGALQEQPSIAIEETLKTRDFVHESVLFRPTSGEVRDPQGALTRDKQGRLIILDPTAFGADPIGVYRAAMAMAFGLSQHKESIELIRGMAQKPLSDELLNIRAQALVELLMTNAASPVRTLDALHTLDLLQRDLPATRLLRGTMPTDASGSSHHAPWGMLLEQVADASKNARAQSQWTPIEQTAFIVARLVFATKNQLEHPVSGQRPQGAMPADLDPLFDAFDVKGADGVPLGIAAVARRNFESLMGN